jgi:hypothetical protein
MKKMLIRIISHILAVTMFVQPIVSLSPVYAKTKASTLQPQSAFTDPDFVKTILAAAKKGMRPEDMTERGADLKKIFANAPGLEDRLRKEYIETDNEKYADFLLWVLEEYYRTTGSTSAIAEIKVKRIDRKTPKKDTDLEKGKGRIPFIEEWYRNLGQKLFPDFARTKLYNNVAKWGLVPATEEILFRWGPFVISYIIAIFYPIAGLFSFIVIGVLSAFTFAILHPEGKDRRVAMRIAVKNQLFLMILLFKNYFSPINAPILILSAFIVPLCIHLYENKYGNRYLNVKKHFAKRLIIWFFVAIVPFILPIQQEDSFVGEKGGATEEVSGPISDVLETGVTEHIQVDTGFKRTLEGRMPMHKDLGQMLFEWKYKRLKKEIDPKIKGEKRKVAEEQAEIKAQKWAEKEAKRYRAQGIYNPSAQEIEDVCGKIGELLYPVMKNRAWAELNPEQIKILLESLFEAESDNRHWIVKEKDGKPEVFVLDSGVGAYGISQITQIAVQELGKIIYDNLRILSKKDANPEEVLNAQETLKVLYALIYADNYSLTYYKSLDLDTVIAFFRALPEEKDKGRKDMSGIMQRSHDSWEYNIRLSAAILFTTFGFLQDKTGEYKDTNAPIWRMVIASYNWSKYGLVNKYETDKILWILQTRETSVHTTRFYKRFKELSGVSLDEMPCWSMHSLVETLVQAVYEETSANKKGEARIIINNLDSTLKKFDVYIEDHNKKAKKKKWKELDFERIKLLLGVESNEEWDSYIAKGYTVRQVLHESLEKKTRHIPSEAKAADGRISRGVESEMATRKKMEMKQKERILCDLRNELTSDGQTVKSAVENIFDHAKKMEGLSNDYLESILEEAKQLFLNSDKVICKITALRSRNINVGDKKDEDFYCGGYVYSSARNTYEFQYAREIMEAARQYDSEYGTNTYIEYFFHEALCHILCRKCGDAGHYMARRMQRVVFKNNYYGENRSILGDIIRNVIDKKVLENQIDKIEKLRKRRKYHKALNMAIELTNRIKDDTRLLAQKRYIEEIVRELREYFNNSVNVLKIAEDNFRQGKLTESIRGYHTVIMSGIEYENDFMQDILRKLEMAYTERTYELDVLMEDFPEYTAWAAAISNIKDKKDCYKIVQDYCRLKDDETTPNELLACMEENLSSLIKVHIVRAKISFAEGKHVEALNSIEIALNLIPPSKRDPRDAIQDMFLDPFDFTYLINFTKKDAKGVKILIDDIVKEQMKDGFGKIAESKFTEALNIFTELDKWFTSKQNTSVLLAIYGLYTLISKINNNLVQFAKAKLGFSDKYYSLLVKAHILPVMDCDTGEESGQDKLTREDMQLLHNIKDIGDLKTILSGIRFWTGAWDEIISILSMNSFPYLIDKNKRVRRDVTQELLDFISSLESKFPEEKEAFDKLKHAIGAYVDLFINSSVEGIIEHANNGGENITGREIETIKKSIRDVSDIRNLLNKFKSDSKAWTKIFLAVIDKIQEFQKELRFRPGVKINIQEIIKIEAIVLALSIDNGLKKRLKLNLVALRKNIWIKNGFPPEFLSPLIEIFDGFPGELMRNLDMPEPFTNADLRKHGEYGALGLAHYQTGRGVEADLEAHKRMGLGIINKRELEQTVWHELIHKASFSSTFEGRPAISPEKWREIAKQGGFVGYFNQSGQFVYIEEDTSDLMQFRYIEYKQWVYQEENGELVNYMSKKSIHEKVMYIPRDRLPEAVHIRESDKERRGGKEYVKVFVREDKGGVTHTKASPLELVAEAGADYIRDSASAEKKSLYRGILEHLAENLFTFTMESGEVRQYYFVNGEMKVKPVTESRAQGAKPLNPAYVGASIVNRTVYFHELAKGVTKIIDFNGKKYPGRISIVLNKTQIWIEPQGGLYVLRYRVDDNPEESYILVNGTYRVGRESGNNVQILDPQVSKRHLEIIVDNDKIVINDNGINKFEVLDSEGQPYDARSAKKPWWIVGAEKTPGMTWSDEDKTLFSEQVEKVKNNSRPIAEGSYFHIIYYLIRDTLRSVKENGLSSAEKIPDGTVLLKSADKPVIEKETAEKLYGTAFVRRPNIMPGQEDDMLKTLLRDALYRQGPFSSVGVFLERYGEKVHTQTKEIEEERLRQGIVFLQGFKSYDDWKKSGIENKTLGYEFVRDGPVKLEEISAIFVPEHLVELVKEAFPGFADKIIPVKGYAKEQIGEETDRIYNVPDYFSAIMEFTQKHPKYEMFWMHGMRLPATSDYSERLASQQDKIKEAVIEANNRAKTGIDASKVQFHIADPKEFPGLGIPRYIGAEAAQDMVYAIGEKGDDGKLHIYVTQRYWDEVLSQNKLQLAETIDHEWDENILGEKHGEAANRAKHFIKEGEEISEYHKFAITQLLKEQDKEALMLHILDILSEKREGEYEGRFREYLVHKMIEAGLNYSEGISEGVVDQIYYALNKRGIEIKKQEIWMALIDAQEEDDAPSLEKIITLINKHTNMKLKDVFELAKEISGYLAYDKEEKSPGGRTLVANILMNILIVLEESGKEVTKEEDIRERFYETLKKLLLDYGMTEVELAGELELIKQGLFLLEYEPLLNLTKVDQGYFEYFRQICDIVGIKADILRKVFSDVYSEYQNQKTQTGLGRAGIDIKRFNSLSAGEKEKILRQKGLWREYKRTETIKGMIDADFADSKIIKKRESKLSKAARRLMLYERIKKDNITGETNVELDVDGDLVELDKAVDFRDLGVTDPKALIRYLSLTAVAKEHGDDLVSQLGIDPNKNVRVSIPEELFLEKIDGTEITYSPGITSVLKKIPGLTVEIRTKDKTKLNAVINVLLQNHSEFKRRIIIEGEFENENDIKESVDTVYVLGSNQENIGGNLEQKIRDNKLKVFSAEGVTLFGVLVYGAKQAGIEKMFAEDGTYTKDAVDLIRKLEIFGVSKSVIDEIIRKNEAFFVIKISERLNQYVLTRCTIDIAA